jgi:hypothetical protein
VEDPYHKKHTGRIHLFLLFIALALAMTLTIWGYQCEASALAAHESAFACVDLLFLPSMIYAPAFAAVTNSLHLHGAAVDFADTLLGNTALFLVIAELIFLAVRVGWWVLRQLARLAGFV